MEKSFQPLSRQKRDAFRKCILSTLWNFIISQETVIRINLPYL